MRIDITAVIERHADVMADKPAIIDPGGRWTYRDLMRAVDRWERTLRDAGAASTRRVATLMNPGRLHLAVILASLRTGAGTIPLNSRLTRHELREFLENCAPAFAVVDDEYRDLIPGPTPVYVLDADGEPRRSTPPVGAAPPSHPADEAIIIGTGGTTGPPKGAVLDTAAVWHWTMSAAYAQQLRHDDVELFGSPFFHSTLLTGLLTPLVGGATVCIPARFDAEHVAAAVADHRVTRIGGAPTMLSRVLAAATAEPRKWASVRTIQFGSTKSPPGFVDDVRAAFPAAELITGYGSTEFGPAARRYTADFAAGVDAGVGRPVPAADVAVVDPETNRPTRRSGIEGEIVVACPWQMSYYTGDRGATRDVIHDSGAILSGDIGRFDDAGYLHLIGRRKDIIITGGENVFPAEVEQALGGLPNVRDLAVYGVADPTWGERIELALSVEGGAQAPTLAEVRRYGRHRLASYKLPRSLAVLDDLPLTSNLKIDKRTLAMTTDLPREMWPDAGNPT